MEQWYTNTEIEQQIPDFDMSFFKSLYGFRYYLDFDSNYNEIAFLEVDFLLEKDNRKFELVMKFSNIFSLYLYRITGNENDLEGGFTIQKLRESGYEKQFKYLIDNYETDIIKFYCENIEVASLKKRQF